MSQTRRLPSMGALAREIRRMDKAIPRAVERAFREGAVMLAGPLVQEAIASTDPHQPVDQGQYKAGWRSYETDGGFLVTNLTKHAVDIERGRGPGPVPFAPIYQWVRRKGIWKDSFKAKVRAGAVKQLRQSILSENRQKAPRGANPMTKAAVSGHNRRARQLGGLAPTIVKQDVIAGIAHAVAAKIEREGYAPRWVLRRAVVDLRSKLPGLIRSQFGEIRA